MGLKKKIVIGVISLLVLIQFIRIDKNNPGVDTSKEFVAQMDVPKDVQEILESSCYDCHSHESVYPWYSNVAPVSWWLKKHINDGRRHLNFSIWGDYEAKRKDHKLEELEEEVEEGGMPLKSYLIVHSEARLDESQRERLTSWVRSVRTEVGEGRNNEDRETSEGHEDEDQDEDDENAQGQMR